MPNGQATKNILRIDMLLCKTANMRAGIRIASGQIEKGAKASGSNEPSTRATQVRITRFLRLILFSGAAAVIDDLEQVNLTAISVKHLEGQVIESDRFTALRQVAELA